MEFRNRFLSTLENIDRKLKEIKDKLDKYMSANLNCSQGKIALAFSAAVKT